MRVANKVAERDGTNGKVNVYAFFSDDTIIKEFSDNAGNTWTVYNDQPITFTENGSIWFRGTNAAGETSDIVQYDVINIDTTPPDPPTAAYVSEQTEEGVLVSATFSEDSAEKKFSLDEGNTWNEYKEPIPFTDNGSVWFQGFDKAGNPSGITKFVVDVFSVVVKDVYVNSTWTGEGEVTLSDGVTKATLDYDAFTEYGKAVEGVAEAGTITIDGGVISFKNGPATGLTTIVGAAATINGESKFEANITVDGTVELSNAYLISGADFIIGNTTYTLSTANVVADTSYTLATGAASFSGKTIDFNGIALTVGAAEATQVNEDFNYQLSLDAENNLVLAVTAYEKPSDLPEKVYVNEAWTGEGEVTLSDGVTKATIGYDAFANYGVATGKVKDNGTVTIDGGNIAFTSVSAKVITVVGAAATINGASVFDNNITVDGTIEFNTLYQIGGISYVSGNTSYSLVVNTVSVGSFTLATEAASLDGKSVAFGTKTIVVGGDAIEDGDYKLALGVTEGTLTLTVTQEGPEPPTKPEKVYVNSTWTGEGEVTLSDGVTKATLGKDAFSDYATAVTKVAEAGTITIDGGVIAFANGTAAGVTTIVGAAATINGATAFDKAITVDGTIEFNTLYQVGGISYVSGNTSYSLVVNTVAVGSYTLATEAASLDGKSVAFGTKTITVGGDAIEQGDYKLALGVTEGTLTLTVTQEGPEPPTPTEKTLYVNSAWSTETTGSIVEVLPGVFGTVGTDAFATGDAAAAKATENDKIEVVGGSVSFTNEITEDITIDATATLTGKATFADGVTVTVNGTIAFDVSQASTEAPQFTGFGNVELGTGATLTLTAVPADLPVGEYLLADDASYLYGATITVEGLTKGLVVGSDDGYVPAEKGGQAYGLDINADGALVLSVVTFDNGADDGTNNDLWIKANKAPNMAIFNGPAVVVDENTETIVLDKKFSVSNELNGGDVTYHNFVGNDGKADATDVRKIHLDTGAALTFSVDGEVKGKLVLYQIVTTVKTSGVTYTKKALQSTSLKLARGQVVYQNIEPKKAVYLEAGDYFLAMEGTLNRTGETSGFYNVSIDQLKSKFYLDDDNGDNNYLYDKKQGGWNDKVLNSDATLIDSSDRGKTVAIDDDEPTHFTSGDWENFVGFGDAMDVKKIELDTAASLVFNLKASAAAKLLVYSVNDKGKVVTSIPAVAVKATDVNGKDTKAKILEKGTYYIAVQSTGAKKGDEAYYNVTVNAASKFYEDDDNGDNNYLYDKKLGWGKVVETEATVLTKGDLQIDATAPTHATSGSWENFVGTGDTGDVLKIQANANMTVSFKIDATDAVNFVIYERVLKNGKYTQKALSTTKLAKNKGFSNTVTYTFKNDGDFYVGVTSTNAKKGSEAYYNVEVTSISGQATSNWTDAVQAADLSMPQSAGSSLELAAADSSNALQSELSFGQNDAEILASGAISSIDSWQDEQSDWQNIAKLA